MKNTKLDRRRKYYLILDCETATLPYASNFSGEAKKKICIAKPLIYDLGWQIIDAKGRVYRKKSYLITEIFSVPSVFNTAYFAEKRPRYLDKLEKREISLVPWEEAISDLIADMSEVECVGAYNSMFDFKKAIPYTELYMKKLYSKDYYNWEAWQEKIIDEIVSGVRSDKQRDFSPTIFSFRGIDYPLFDVWGLSCNSILNCDEYREKCKSRGWKTASGKFYVTNAEKAYSFIKGIDDFEEKHTAVEDAEIESEILAEVFKRIKPKDMTMGIIYFPFKILGRADTEE